MRLNYKPVLAIIFVAIFSTLLLVDLGSAGTLRHMIYSPFGMPVLKDNYEETYTSSTADSATTTIVTHKYLDIDEYTTDDFQEPFCRVGGQYRVKVHNDPSPGAGVQNWDLKMYYCKTTLDLLERVRIPQSWQDADLIVYCNDGANINNNDTNYDFITTQMNTYKACIIRNLNIDSQNTLVYGYDVGNIVVDNFNAYFFQNDTKTGPVLIDMEYKEITNEEEGHSTAYGGKYEVPYKEEVIIDPYTRLETPTGNYIPRTADEARVYISDEYSIRSDIEVYHQSNNVVTEEGCDFITVCEPTEDSSSIYSIRIPYTYKIIEYSYNYTKLNTNYYFGYDFNDAFYYMKDFNDDLEVPILDVFPDASIDISRVALFKKIGSKYIYGYETPSNMLISNEEPFNETVEPIYKITLQPESQWNFGQDRCVNSLQKYTPATSIQANTGVKCFGNEIEIVSSRINSAQGDSKYAFHLFKNIVTSLDAGDDIVS